MQFCNWLKHNQLVMLGAILGLSLVIAALTLGRFTERFSPSTIDVTGVANTLVKSDRAVWTLEVSGNGANAAQAYAQLKLNQSRVMQFLAAQGVPKTAISRGVTNQISYYERDVHGNQTRQLSSQELRQTLTVTTPDVDKVEHLAAQASELLSDGVEMTVNPPQFVFSKLESLKVKLLANATQNAKARAVAVAKSAGNQVGVLRSASTGVFQITPPDSTDVSDWGISDTTTIDKKITAVVNVSFQLHE
ncbi:MAG: SIMPL domain-containing protein [Vampirovibrionales bacterium]|nr:SIMPL domain-containing protein [Vampirovibrionales bacterium]